MPAKVQLSGGEMIVDGGFTVGIAGAKDTRIEHAAERFLNQLSLQTALPWKAQLGTDSAKLVIQAQNADNNLLALGSDESYLLEVTPAGAKLSAANDLGILHGLQTFLQLVKTSTNGFAVPALRIDDQPRFPWRGLMIDASRHF
ncbi:MAG TPA: glycoside hydrolase family 20 zincin-like fold domain-containing protein, partial [Terriglobales bacterium]|nr:glycoside hydrolase family 20 zincin-like fold domain-containing protein [Terriglobales bacterium]